MSRGAGAVLVAGITVAAYAAWRSARGQKTEVFRVEPAVSRTPQPDGNDELKRNLIGWGVDTLFDALGGIPSGGSTPEQRPEQGGGWRFDLGDLLTGGASGGVKGTGSDYQREAPPKNRYGGILDLIGSAEAPQGYDQVYGGTRLNPPRRITTMTVGEVLAWQRQSVAAGSRSSAAGKYQIIRKTLQSLVDQGHVSTSDRFDADTQDRLAVVLMRRRGLDRFEDGSLSAEGFANQLAREWAGLPVATGPRAGGSYYGGDGLNKSTVSVDRVLDVLRRGL